MRAVVIGGGLAGLSAAIQLSVDGASVTLIESNEILGGRVRKQDSGDWVLDSGLHLMRRRGPFQQLLRRLRAPRVLGKRWNATHMVGIGTENSHARDALSAMRIEGGDAAERAIVPTGGWSNLVVKIITATEEMGVRILTESQAEGLILDESGKIRAVRVSNEEVECDGVVLAIPPPATIKLLQGINLSTNSLEACTEHRVATIDAALIGKPMLPYSGFFDLESGVIVIDQTKPDRVPVRGSEDDCTLLHAVCLNSDGNEGLNAIKNLLDSRCPDWRNMVAVRRSTKSVMLHPCKESERVPGDLFLDSGIALAGTHVLTSHVLTDAAVDSGRKAAKALKNR